VTGIPDDQAEVLGAQLMLLLKLRGPKDSKGVDDSRLATVPVCASKGTNAPVLNSDPFHSSRRAGSPDGRSVDSLAMAKQKQVC
jgi:hypothetical protein